MSAADGFVVAFGAGVLLFLLGVAVITVYVHLRDWINRWRGKP